MREILFSPCRECGRVVGPSQLKGAIGRLEGVCPTCREYDRRLRQVAARLRRAVDKRREFEDKAAAAREEITVLCREQLELVQRRTAYVTATKEDRTGRRYGAGKAA